MKKVITPVGTSIFNNFQEHSKKLDIHLKVLKNEKVDNWDKLFDSRIVPVHKEIVNWAKEKKDASAEIKSLYKIQEQVNDELEVYLICSETILSRLAAEIISEYFNVQPDCSITVKFDYEREDRIKGLQVEDRRLFEQEGIVKLVKRFNEITGGYTENVIMNITGGYKAFIPYLSILGQINNVPIYYIFEDTDELIRIPQAPISLDKGLFSKYYRVFQELSEGVFESWEQYRRRNNIGDDFKDCIMEYSDGDQTIIGLNGIGVMLWEEYKHQGEIVFFPHGSKYSKEEDTRKRQLEKAILELIRRLRTLNDPQKIKMDKDLNHLDDKGPEYVYKHTNPQIRIQYKYDFDNNHLTIYNYYFINDDVDDKKYEKYLDEEFENLKNREVFAVALKPKALY